MAVKFRDYIRGLPLMDITADKALLIVEELSPHIPYIQQNLFDAVMALLVATEGVQTIVRGRLLSGVIDSLHLTPTQTRDLYKYKTFASVMFSIGKVGDFRSPHHFTACPAAFLRDFMTSPNPTKMPPKLLESSLASDARPLVAAGMPLPMAKDLLPGAFVFADYEETLSKENKEFKEAARIMTLIPCVAKRIFHSAPVSARNPIVIPAVALLAKHIIEYAASSCKVARQEFPAHFDYMSMRRREDRNGRLSAVLFLPKDSMVMFCTQDKVSVPAGYFKTSKPAYKVNVLKESEQAKKRLRCEI
jgi:hypothetical protein